LRSAWRKRSPALPGRENDPQDRFYIAASNLSEQKTKTKTPKRGFFILVRPEGFSA
jgi:hypothetical protein